VLRCGLTPLASPAGLANVTAGAVDPTGKYIVGNNTGTEPVHTSAKTGKVDQIETVAPVLWTNGKAQALPMPARSVYGAAVNASGTVVAVAGTTQWTSVVRYTNGVPVTLKTPKGEWRLRPYPRINAGGDIIVNAYHPKKPENDDTVLLWPAGSDTAIPLPLPARAEGLDITDAGTIVGNVVSAGNTRITPYVWDQQGHGRKLPLPAGQDGNVTSSQGEWAAGNLWPSGVVVRWNLRTGEVTATDQHGPANAINGQGWIVAVGTVLRDDVTVKLDPAGDQPGEPVGVADTGLVVGSRLDGSPGALTWHCDR
jgi:hypothetical protein